MISIEFDPEARKFLKGLKGAARRMRFGTARVLAFVAKRVAADVTKRAGGRVLDYDRLVVVRVGRHTDMQVALLLPTAQISLSASDLDTMVVYPQASGSDPKVEVLVAHSPWPASMIPQGLPDDAPVRFIGRRVSKEQARDRGKEMMTPGLRALLETRGMTATESRLEFPWPVEEDAIWIAVRSEFGIDTEAIPHWRPAIQKAQSYVTVDLMDALATYIVTGDQSRLRRGYRLSVKHDDVAEQVMIDFQQRLGIP